MFGEAHRDMVGADDRVMDGDAQPGELGELGSGRGQVGVVAAVEQEAADR